MTELAIAGLVLQAGSQISQGITQNNIADRNADIAERDAVARRQKAEVDADIQSRQDERTRSAARAKRGASGIDPNTGSSLITEAEDEFVSELNRNNILFGGEVEAKRFENEAEVTRAGGASKRSAGFLGAGSTLLTGIGNLKRL